MNTSELRDRLIELKTSAIKKLAVDADVSERCLWKIRGDQTETASEKTKARILAHLPRRRKAKA